MTVHVDVKGISRVAVIEAEDLVIKDVGSAMDFLADLSYNHDCHKAIVPKENVCEDFFDLKTRIAGEILQKFTNYNLQLAIVGDFSGYTSKSLKDFIYESNKGRQVNFLGTMEEALEALHKG